jgi:hypothetical protein
MIYARGYPPNTRIFLPFGMMTSLQCGSNPVQKGIHNTRLGMPKTNQTPGAHFPITKA